MHDQNKYYLIPGIIALAISGFLIFQNLGVPPIRQWDEAIYADNALDMYTTGDPLVMRRNGEPTFYNTKPPMVIWMQAISLHIFGVNEFAIRFPSALAGLLTCIAVFLFSIITVRDIRLGIIAVLVLATSQGFNMQHVVKTGDLDAVLVFWVTGYTLLFFHYLLAKPTKDRGLFLAIGCCIVGAFLSKGVAGLMPLPGLVLCTIVCGKFKNLISRWDIWIIAGFTLAACLGYYALREVVSPGYLYRTWYSEYSRYFVNLMSWHNHPWYYYFWNWQRLGFFTPYVYALPFCIVIGMARKDSSRMTLLLTLHALTFVAILSYPIIKLMWYDAPVYPVLALLIAVGIIGGWQWIVEKIPVSTRLQPVVSGCILVLLLWVPVREQFMRNLEWRLPVDVLEREGAFLRTLRHEHPSLTHFKVFMSYAQSAHYTQIDFYRNSYNRYNGYQISMATDSSAISSGDTVAVCQEVLKDWLTATYDVRSMTTDTQGCEVVILGQRRITVR